MTTVSLRDLIVRTLVARWDELSDAAQEWAIDRGYARYPELSAELADAEDWRDDWRSPEGGSWPCYTLDISVDGREIGAVTGWHYVGPWSGQCDGRPSSWTERDDDGACCGLPRVWRDGDGPYIDHGDNVGQPLLLPRAGEDGRALVYDEDRRGEHNRALEEAADGADHGDAPTLDDLDAGDGDHWSDVWIIRGYRVEPIRIFRIDEFPNGDDNNGQQTYLVTGYVAVDDDGEPLGEIRENDADAIADIDGVGDDGKVYRQHGAAEKALVQMVRDRIGDIDTPDGLDVEWDGDAIAVTPEGANEPYHLDADEIAAVCTSPAGWLAVWDSIMGAYRQRETLAARRGWNESMDAVIAEKDPFVGIADSIAGGNCRAMSEEFARLICEREGGEVGAVRASRILAIRDDVYTRRACRMAAARMIGAQ